MRGRACRLGARRRSRQWEAQCQVAQAELRTAQQQWKRQQGLFGQGYISRSELEIAQLTVERARANEVTQNEELRLAREGAHPEAIKEAEQQAEAARQALHAGDAQPEVVAERKAELTAAEAEATRAAKALDAARGNGL